MNRYLKGAEEYNIAECNYYKYEKETKHIFANYFFRASSDYYLWLGFMSADLFNEMLTGKLKKSYQCMVVVWGGWNRMDKVMLTERVCAKYINFVLQIAVIKKAILCEN